MPASRLLMLYFLKIDGVPWGLEISD